MAEDLAGGAEALLSAGGPGWLLRLAQAGCRLGKFQRNPAQHMMVQHKHHQQVELHHRQQPGGCPSRPWVFQYSMHNVLSGPYRVLRLARVAVGTGGFRFGRQPGPRAAATSEGRSYMDADLSPLVAERPETSPQNARGHNLLHCLE